MRRRLSRGALIGLDRHEISITVIARIPRAKKYARAKTRIGIDTVIYGSRPERLMITFIDTTANAINPTNKVEPEIRNA